MRASSKVFGVALGAACCAVLLIWYVAVAEDHRGRLAVAFLPGNGIFITTPSGRHVLIDGGEGTTRALGSVLPLYERSIDAVIARAPNAAKTSGLIDVLTRYDVELLAQSAAHSGAPQEASFTATVARKEGAGMSVRELSRGDVINFGDGTYIETLFPDRDVSGMTAADGCLILKLVYGNTSLLFSCERPAIESYLAMLDGSQLAANIVYARSDASPLLIGFAQPEYAVASDPCDGQTPRDSVFARFSIPVATPCAGSVVFTSDARTIVKE